MRRPIGAALAVALAWTLTACGGVGTSGAGGPADESLTIAVTAAPRSLDPVNLDGGQQAYLWTALYDTLLYVDNAGKLQPNAVESWEYSDDGLKLTMQLREGLTFSSGAPVTAGTVKANLERNKTTPGQQQVKLADVESVETPGGRTVIVRFSSHDPAFLYNMTQDAGVLADPATVEDDRTVTNPVESGPYVLDTTSTVNGSTYVLERRDDYWNVGAYPFETVRVRVLSDQTAALNALRSGEVDVATVPANQVESIKAAGNVNVAYNPTASIAFINLADRAGTRLEPLADLRVRQAINHAFDRRQIVDKLLSGAGVPTVQPFNQKGIAYDPSLDAAYPYDVDRAKRLLAEAGYPDGFEVSMPSTVISRAFEPTISQALGEIGIDVTWAPTPAQNATASIIAGDYPMFFFISGATVAQREVPRQLREAVMNPFTWSDPELDRLLEAADGELDEAKQAEIYQEINAYVVENALFAPLLFVGSSVATSEHIAYLGDGSNNFPTVRSFGVKPAP